MCDCAALAAAISMPADAGPLLMRTYVATPATRERNWLVVDATGKTLGRLATQIADALRGKRKPEFTPHCDVGDFVIFEEMIERRPEEIIRLAVKGMLPRTRLGRAQLRKLKVYAGPDHPHSAQKPQPMEVKA
jgi:large subunit ribosomal protein L13